MLVMDPPQGRGHRGVLLGVVAAEVGVEHDRVGGGPDSRQRFGVESGHAEERSAVASPIAAPQATAASVPWVRVRVRVADVPWVWGGW